MQTQAYRAHGTFIGSIKASRSMLSQAVISFALSCLDGPWKRCLWVEIFQLGEVDCTGLPEGFPWKWGCSVMGSCPAGVQPSNTCLLKYAKPNSWVFAPWCKPASCTRYNMRSIANFGTCFTPSCISHGSEVLLHLTKKQEEAEPGKTSLWLRIDRQIPAEESGTASSWSAVK